MNLSEFLSLLCLLCITSTLQVTATEAFFADDALNATLLQVPDTRQSTEYSCGAAALQAVMSYWGRDFGEEDLREILNTDPESGTYPDDIIRVAHQMGLKADYKENLTLEDIESYLQKRISNHGGLPGLEKRI